MRALLLEKEQSGNNEELKVAKIEGKCVNSKQ